MESPSSNNQSGEYKHEGALEPCESLDTEDVLIRSYDHQWAYDLEIEILSPGGGTVFSERYYLQPGHTESEFDVVEPGEYLVKAILDNSSVKTNRCRLGQDFEHTVLIEVGNGTMSLTAAEQTSV